MINKIYQNYLNKQSQKIRRLETRRSNTKLTLMKAYAIVAVVCSHCSGGGVTFPMANWITPSFFFMQLFMFTSGYFYKEETDRSTLFPVLKSKFFALVLPYFGWNLFYGLANHFFRSLKVIRYGDPLTLHSLFIRPWIDGHQYHFNIASWFLLSLFIDFMVIFLLRKFLHKLRILNDSALLLFTFAVSLISIYLAQKGFNTGIALCFIRAGFLLPYFQLGYYYKKHEKFFTQRKPLLIAVLFATMYAAWVMAGEQGAWPTTVFAKFTGDPLIITVLGICGILITATVCDILAPAFENGRLTRWIGDHTFTIMMHHGFIFFLINFGIYLLTFFFKITSFDIDKFQSTLWYACPWRDSKIYIVYVVAGVFIPLILKWCYERLILHLHKKQSNRS